MAGTANPAPADELAILAYARSAAWASAPAGVSYDQAWAALGIEQRTDFLAQGWERYGTPGLAEIETVSGDILSPQNGLKSGEGD